MEFLSSNIEQTNKLAEILAFHLKDKGGFITLLGEIGAGKTALARHLIKSLGVKEYITSPSFVILNEYKSEYLPIYHFDLYRLEENGIDSIKEELREYSKENVLVLVEWANFGEGELPFDRMTIEICYDIQNYSTERKIKITGTNDYYNNIIEKTYEMFQKKAI